jgi:hypothetical protein
MLHNALALLNREFPDAKLVEARVEFRSGERHGETHGCARNWTNEPTWTLQVNNDRESHSVLSEALAALRATLARKVQVPGLAERVAIILREIPTEGFVRSEVLEAAQRLVDLERRER